jgi:hypothetical protein
MEGQFRVLVTHTRSYLFYMPNFLEMQVVVVLNLDE